MQIPPVLTAELQATKELPKMKILDLIDFKKVDTLLEGFNKSTGFVTAILDLEGNVLSKSGWRHICTDFHRINALTAKRCTISDTELAGKMALGEKYHFYKCLNGLVDVAVPVVINGDHIANLFSGQFFFEEPDTAFFVEQAKKYGFDEEKYLERLKEVPVVPKDRVKPAMDFLLNMTEMIAEITMHRVQEVQLNEALKENQAKLVVQNDELKIAKEKTENSEIYNRTLFEQSAIGLALVSPDGKLVDVNSALASILGRTVEETKGLTYWDITPAKYHETEKKQLDLLNKTGKYPPLEKEYIHKDGHLVPVRLQGSILERNGKKYFWSAIEDITERKRAQNLLQESEERLTKIFRSSPSAIIVSRISDGKFIDLNEAACKIYGYNREEIIGHTSLELDIIDPDERAKLTNNLKTNGFLRNCEVIVHSKKEGDRIVLYSMEILTIDGDQYMLTSMIDITERKQSEENLAKTNKLLSDMMDNSSSLIYMLDTEGRFIAANRLFEKIFKKNREEITGRKREDFMPEELATQHFSNDLEVMRSRKAISFEEENLEEDGTHYYLTTKFPIIDNRDNLYGVSGISTDITDRKKTEESLRQSEETYSNIFELSPIAAVFWDKEAKIIFWNKAAENVFGWAKEEVIGKKFTEFFVPESSRKYVEENVDLLIKNISRETTMNENLRKDGSAILCEWSNTIIYDKDGNPSTIISLANDITEQKRAEEALKESEERYRSIFENSSVAILFTAPDGKILSANDYACQIFGRTEQEICETGRNGMVDLSDPRLSKYLNERESNGRARGELTFVKKDGTHFECEFSSVVFTDVHGNQRSSMVLRDLTQQKLAEHEIIALNQSLENKVAERTLQLTKANKELETFTYSVSHDLKAPLRGIDGYSKLLLDIYGQNLNEEANHFINTIRNSTLQMNQLIEDLLQYSRLERSQLQIRPLKINSLVDDIFKMHEEEVMSHHFSIKTNIPDIELFADPNGIQIALRNLIGNAIKFTKNVPNPEINMTLQENSDSWIISIQDNGIGFDMKYSQRIFEIFQRLQRAEDYPGTGIGLAMVAKAMHRMNGKVRADSIPGKGATFYLEIPKPTK